MKVFSDGVFPMATPSQLPTSIADFNCFTVNVWSGDIYPTNVPVGCTKSAALYNAPWGSVSPLRQKNAGLTVMVPKGQNRTFDAFGIYPSSYISECGGTSTGGSGNVGYAYFLGRTPNVTIAGGTIVNIPISYTANTMPAVTCDGAQDPPDAHLVPNGTSGKGRVFYSSTSQCLDGTTLPALSDSNVSTSLTEMNTAANLTLISQPDGSKYDVSCTSPSSAAAVVAAQWDVSEGTGFPNTNYYTKMRLEVKLSSGGGSGACNTIAMTGQASVSILTSGGTWSTGVSVPAGTDITYKELITSEVDLANYVKNSKITVRVVAPAFSPSGCSQIYLDHIKLRLRHP